MSGGPDLLERVRMCLAEVGEPTRGLALLPKGRVAFPPGVAYDVQWRALSIARVATGEKQSCLACSARWTSLPQWSRPDPIASRDACLANRPCMEDCGLDRSAVAS